MSVFYSQEERLLSLLNSDGFPLIQTTKGSYSIHYFNEKAIETRFNSEKNNDSSFSHAIIEKTKFFKFKSTSGTNHTVTCSVINPQKFKNTLSVALDSVPFNITYYYGNKRLFRQRENKSEDSRFKLDFAISSDEVIYGGGARALERMVINKNRTVSVMGVLKSVISPTRCVRALTSVVQKCELGCVFWLILQERQKRSFQT